MTYSIEFNLHSQEFSTQLRQRRGSLPGTCTASEIFSVEIQNSSSQKNIAALTDASSRSEKPEAAIEADSSEEIESGTSPTSNKNEDSPPKQEELNAWSREFVGIPINYFSVGVVYAGSVSILYPILVIQHGVDTAFFTAASSHVTVFWSYKIFFGILCDCLPIFGQKWKPYITVGVS